MPAGTAAETDLQADKAQVRKIAAASHTEKRFRCFHMMLLLGFTGLKCRFGVGEAVGRSLHRDGAWLH